MIPPTTSSSQTNIFSMTPHELAHHLSSPQAPGAWLLHGPSGIGKTHLALEAARLVAPLAANRFFLDSITLDNLSQNAPSRLEAFRQWLRGPVHSSTIGTGVRIALIVEVDRLSGPHISLERFLSPLLKTLEEPPARLRFLLTAVRPGRLPATLRSRCVRVALPTPDPSLLLNRLGGDPVQTLTLLRLAGGSPGLAQQMRENGIESVYQHLLDLIQSPAPFPRRALVQIVDHLLAGTNKQEARLQSIEYLALCIHHILRGAAYQIAGDPLFYQEWPQESLALQKYAQRIRSDRLAQSSAFLEHIRSETQQFVLEPRHALIRLLFCLEYPLFPIKRST